MFRKKSTGTTTVKRRSPHPKKNSRLLEMAIVAIFALVVIYGASFAIRVTHGVSKTVDSPEYTIRLQILNGCGLDGAAGKAARKLPKMIKMPLEIDIVDVGDFDAYHVKESFLILRDKNQKGAEILAEQIGLDPDNLVYEPIENNIRSVSVTLVVGEDFDKLFN
ncbi:MAG: LytR C-terminal domain-containing protein [Candidatus Zixiibacteriota bacterium]